MTIFDKKLLQWTLVFVFATNINTMSAQEMNNGGSLNMHQQRMAAIAALTATGNIEQLKIALDSGLNVGLTVNEVKEALIQLYAYCGFPRSLNALNTLMSVLEERKAKGIIDPVGKDASSVAENADKYQVGKKTLQMLTGKEEKDIKSGVNAFAPTIDIFLKKHLFADIFSRDVLTFRQREFVTISALSAMTGVEPQLQAHIAMGRNTGITDNQLLELAGLIDNIGRAQANVLRKLLSQPQLQLAQNDVLIRISEIEIFPEYLQEYNAILKEEASQSVKVEPGVIAIYPMYQKEKTNNIRIVEIYASHEAYKSHLETPHFQYYKTSTQKMVKSLKLVDMEALDSESMELIFKKLSK